MDGVDVAIGEGSHDEQLAAASRRREARAARRTRASLSSGASETPGSTNGIASDLEGSNPDGGSSAGSHGEGVLASAGYISAGEDEEKGSGQAGADASGSGGEGPGSAAEGEAQAIVSAPKRARAARKTSRARKRADE